MNFSDLFVFGPFQFCDCSFTHFQDLNLPNLLPSVVFPLDNHQVPPRKHRNLTFAIECSSVCNQQGKCFVITHARTYRRVYAHIRTYTRGNYHTFTSTANTSASVELTTVCCQFVSDFAYVINPRTMLASPLMTKWAFKK